jgi:hypothetical protein
MVLGPSRASPCRCAGGRTWVRALERSQHVRTAPDRAVRISRWRAAVALLYERLHGHGVSLHGTTSEQYGDEEEAHSSCGSLQLSGDERRRGKQTRPDVGLGDPGSQHAKEANVQHSASSGRRNVGMVPKSCNPRIRSSARTAHPPTLDRGHEAEQAKASTVVRFWPLAHRARRQGAWLVQERNPRPQALVQRSCIGKRARREAHLAGWGC